MGRSALMSFSAVYIFFICTIYEHLVFKINATFFIEVHDRNNVNDVSISLYKCSTPSAVRCQPTEISTMTLPPSYTTNEDISCAVVNGQTRRQKIYSKANFYLAVDLRRADGRRIILRSRTEDLPSSMFVGVTTDSATAVDYPALSFLNVRQLNQLRYKIMVTLPARFLGRDLSFEALVRYMGTGDFYQLAWPHDTCYYIPFARLMRRVLLLYTNDVVNARQHRVSLQEQAEAQRDVKWAIKLLLPKLIDPCFVLSNYRDRNVSADRDGVSFDPLVVANVMCHEHCQFLSVTSSLYPDASSCGRALGDGTCQGRVCKCEKKRKRFECVIGPSLGIMIKCSNEIRIGLARSVNMGL